MVHSELDEKLLIETAQRDPRHFAELYRMHFDRVYAYVARRVGTRSDAQDLTAEVFQQALANLGRFDYLGDEEGGDPTEAAYGSNYARLQQLKAKYDPDNFFHMNQNIRPAG